MEIMWESQLAVCFHTWKMGVWLLWEGKGRAWSVSKTYWLILKCPWTEGRNYWKQTLISNITVPLKRCSGSTKSDFFFCISCIELPILWLLYCKDQIMAGLHRYARMGKRDTRSYSLPCFPMYEPAKAAALSARTRKDFFFLSFAAAEVGLCAFPSSWPAK